MLETFMASRAVAASAPGNVVRSVYTIVNCVSRPAGCSSLRK